MKKKILKIIKAKHKRPLVCLTAYSKPMAKILDKYCDIVLVGDSLGMVVKGEDDTHSVTIDEIGHPSGVYSGTHIFLKTLVAVHSTLVGNPNFKVL